MITEIIKIDKDNPESDRIKKAVDKLQQGAIIAFPTETVYGLGANAKIPQAIERLYVIKNRPREKPFTFLATNIAQIEENVKEILPAAYRLMDRYWPGPLTVILNSKDSQTIGFRIPRAKIAFNLIKLADFPIVAPSANLSGQQPALDVARVIEDFSGKIELIIDGGKVEIGESSTVVDVTKIPFKIIRSGSISQTEIENFSKKKTILFVCTGNSCRSVMAHAILEKRLKEENRQDFEVVSAGIGAFEGMPASKETIMLLAKEGIDVSNHCARRLTDDMIKRSDLILVMQRFQEDNIIDRLPSAKGRVYLLKEFSRFAQDDLEIVDPIGKGITVYQEVFSVIKEAVDRLIDLI